VSRSVTVQIETRDDPYAFALAAHLVDFLQPNIGRFLVGSVNVIGMDTTEEIDHTGIVLAHLS
jgi:hypothetical protein